MVDLTSRLAEHSDLRALQALINHAIGELQKPFLTEAQIASSRAIMGLDRQLIEDGTYFVIESGGGLAGCGGWSRRATLYGSDSTPGRSAALLDPARDPARIRAMYTHPGFARRGVGRLILQLCEDVARAEGFSSMALMATMSGMPLYLACGYIADEPIDDATGGIPVPMCRMHKPL